MDIDEHSPSDGYASQACTAYRQKKRKCDKILPTCSLCQRTGRECDYSEDIRPAQFTNEDFLSLRNEVSELKSLLLAQAQNGSTAQRLEHIRYSDESPVDLLTPPTEPSPWNATSSSSFPNMFFLDSFMFVYQGFQVTMPHVRIPSGAMACLGNAMDLRAMVESYFDTVHSYFPIISKVRLFQTLASLSHEPGADLALLFLAIKLISTTIPEGSSPQTQLYLDVKSFLSYVESQNGFSIQSIQALLLIALYEVGNSIYPAAYLSVGHAARIGHAMGLHTPHAPQMLPKPITWTEQEERRRVWWAIFILDRITNIGARSKPFATPDPDLSTHLPTDDASWDAGKMLVAAPLALSASSTVKASPFARTCQAAHLLSKVLTHMNDRTLPPDYRFTEALQLDRTIRAFSALLPSEADADDTYGPTALCTAMGICYSGLLALYDMYSCTETARQNGAETGSDNELVVQKMCIEGIYAVAEEVLVFSRRVRGDVIGRVSPLVVEALYSGAANFSWAAKESADQGFVSKAGEIKELLSLIDGRWRVAGEYRRVVEAGEFHYAGLTTG